MTFLLSMSRDTFRTNVLACISKWGEKDKRMTQRSHRFFSAFDTNLCSVEFNGRFDRARGVLAELRADQTAHGDTLVLDLWADRIAFFEQYEEPG